MEDAVVQGWAQANINANGKGSLPASGSGSGNTAITGNGNGDSTTVVDAGQGGQNVIQGDLNPSLNDYVGKGSGQAVITGTATLKTSLRQIFETYIGWWAVCFQGAN